jgi:MOSC domain-containing protein YiiM
MNIKKVKSVSLSSTHSFSKNAVDNITLVEGLGVEGDAHFGKTVKHRYLVKKDPTKPNLRQVHLLHYELIEELNEKGFSVSEGDLGENITTMGIELLNLPTDTILKIGIDAVIQIKGLRDPCVLIDRFQKGLLKAVIEKDKNGNVIRKTGVMGIVQKSGLVKINDEIEIIYPQKPYMKLECV